MSDLRNPYYAILIAPEKQMRKKIVRGEKTITIREGHRDYRPGFAVLCCHIVPWAVAVTITEVRHCLLSEVTEEEFNDDGFATREQMLSELKRFYPMMTMESPVTVIRWKDVSGALVSK